MTGFSLNNKWLIPSGCHDNVICPLHIQAQQGDTANETSVVGLLKLVDKLSFPKGYEIGELYIESNYMEVIVEEL